MSDFRIVNNKNEIILDDRWVVAPKFKKDVVDAKGRKVETDYQGRKYRIIEKRERAFTVAERIGRMILGTLILLCSFEFVSKLFTKENEGVRFGVLFSDPKDASLNNFQQEFETFGPDAPADILANAACGIL